MLVLGSLMALGYSLLSVNYYIDGLDKGISGVMRQLARTTEITETEPKHALGFTIASRWQDMPPIIQQRFSPPVQVGVLHKTKDQPFIFSLPTNLFFVVRYLNSEGETRYVSRVMLENDRPKLHANAQSKERILLIAITAIVAITLFTFVLLIIMKKIAKPVESLKNWAKLLNKNNLQQKIPDFKYSELNILARIIRSSLLSAHDTLEREQRFLSYASHELRTPISVIRSNVELLNRLSEKYPLHEKQTLTLQRIERAGLTMSDLTDTLLWLSRNEERHNQPESIKLHEKITILSNELTYLLNAKLVDVQICVDEQVEIITDATACHIVLTNLIRNAFQHTQHGQVEIIQQGSRVTIINTSTNTDLNASIKQNTENGYGLGLQLSEKIIKRHKWVYEINDQPGRYQVLVDFS
ncbi:HAMP domain-containing histidine kinase [Pseudoalteromonas sp. MMG010]|uniref:sensor histidine kinase n=1 Tax=Pseudoalteromonas sp. MMG010 TaxID=2822685 RepID=UPI001B3A7B6E|nr:HAMP domain-containing sensor histidine kinase [Pseudoalteromonas sp. MMG010]MBQ4832026.1 HAMP domain-containing histidine kinase [Pseudoalteromonas sp. MMG010]